MAPRVEEALSAAVDALNACGASADAKCVGALDRLEKAVPAAVGTWEVDTGTLSALVAHLDGPRGTTGVNSYPGLVASVVRLILGGPDTCEFEPAGVLLREMIDGPGMAALLPALGAQTPAVAAALADGFVAHRQRGPLSALPLAPFAGEVMPAFGERRACNMFTLGRAKAAVGMLSPLLRLLFVSEDVKALLAARPDVVAALAGAVEAPEGGSGGEEVVASALGVLNNAFGARFSPALGKAGEDALAAALARPAFVGALIKHVSGSEPLAARYASMALATLVNADGAAADAALAAPALARALLKRLGSANAWEPEAEVGSAARLLDVLTSGGSRRRAERLWAAAGADGVRRLAGALAWQPPASLAALSSARALARVLDASSAAAGALAALAADKLAVLAGLARLVAGAGRGGVALPESLSLYNSGGLRDAVAGSALRALTHVCGAFAAAGDAGSLKRVAAAPGLAGAIERILAAPAPAGSEPDDSDGSNDSEDDEEDAAASAVALIHAGTAAPSGGAAFARELLRRAPGLPAALRRAAPRLGAADGGALALQVAARLEEVFAEEQADQGRRQQQQQQQQARDCGSSGSGGGGDARAKKPAACAECGVSPAAGGGKLRSCSGCYSVAYCSPACQKQHWQAHRKACKAAAAAAKAAGPQ
ncbi:MAG: hypothetical protein J3K34DRAFT_489842 [Monoraphidium minutum]|nr:MAG: hypothetical protein J3K34DRAFT_489842 [Monoraphidium minutum]